jgi:hypothetical protein
MHVMEQQMHYSTPLIGFGAIIGTADWPLLWLVISLSTKRAQQGLQVEQVQ